MTALKITDVKAFMQKLLAADTFDNFLIYEAVVKTATTFTIDGRINEEFFDANDVSGESDGSSRIILEDLQKWGNVKAGCFELIKGKTLPLYFKVVLQLSRENTEKFLASIGSGFELEDIGGLYMNISFDRQELKVVTGSSLKVFSMDKSLDREWDDMVLRFLRKHEIQAEEI